MASSSTPLLDFVTRYHEEPGFPAQFAADPAGTMTSAGLSADQQEIVLSRDLERLNAAVGEESGAHSEDMQWPFDVVIAIITPSDGADVDLDTTGE